MLAIRLSSDIQERLTTLAKKTGRTKTFYAREAILTHLEDLEDYYLAERVAADVRTGKEPVYSSSEVRANLGLGH